MDVYTIAVRISERGYLENGNIVNIPPYLISKIKKLIKRDMNDLIYTITRLKRKLVFTWCIKDRARGQVVGRIDRGGIVCCNRFSFWKHLEVWNVQKIFSILG